MVQKKDMLIKTGMSLKFRTVNEGGMDWLVATIWMDGEKFYEVARMDSQYFTSPEDPNLTRWVETVGAIFHAKVKRDTGLNMEGRIGPPDYTGED